MQPITVTVGPLNAGSANSVALSQTPTKGPLTLNGSLATAGVVTMDKPRQVLITTGSGTESTKTFTITGTDWAGSPISEVVQGPSATTATSVLSYLTITSIVISANAAGALTVGTNGVAYSPWARLDGFAAQVIGLQCTVSGTANYTVQSSFDDPNSPTASVAPQSMTWINSQDPSVVTATTSLQSFFPYCPVWVRTQLNSGSGSVVTTVQQSSSVPY